MIDLTPGRKSLEQRYGTPLPREALAALLEARLGREEASIILQELGPLEARYARAVRLEAARTLAARYGMAVELNAGQQKALRKARALLSHAEEYLEGAWKP